MAGFYFNGDIFQAKLEEKKKKMQEAKAKGEKVRKNKQQTLKQL